MHHYRAKRIIKTKYRETKVVNYRQENNDFNTLLTCTFLDCDEYRTDHDGQIDTTRQKCALGIQYKHESKEDITGFISKPVARPEYRTIYQHKGIFFDFGVKTYSPEQRRKCFSNPIKAGDGSKNYEVNGI